MRGPAHAVTAGIRYYPHWRSAIGHPADPLAVPMPWITFETRYAFLESFLRPDQVVFEYGSGGSSLYYASRVGQVVSVEHEKTWYEQLRRALADRDISNCDLRFVPPQPDPAALGADPADPEGCVSSFEAYRGCRFYDYALQIAPFPDAYFDLVVVDGRARPSCIWHARAKVKPGGYLMLDNSERPHYARAKTFLSGWQRHAYYGPGPYALRFWETTIWRRPGTP